MFKPLMVPVDLAHVEPLTPALTAATDLAKLYNADITYVGVSADAPGALGHNPKEFAGKLADFAAAQGVKAGVRAAAHAMIANDPRTELDDALLRAVDETGADLVVMQSHIPGLVDYIWPSNGGKLAGHATCSVLVVRAQT